MNDYIMNMPNTEQLHKKLMVHDEVKDIILKGKKFVEKNIEIKELASMGYMLLMSSKKQDQIVFIKAKRLIQVLDNLEMNFKAIEIINELNIAFTKLEAKNDKILKDTSNVVTKLKNKMTILQNECEKAIDKIINTSLPNIAKKYKETLNSYKGKERKTIYHFYDKNGETKGFDDAQQQEFIKYSLKTNKDIVKDYTVRMEELMEEKRLLENSVIQLKADSTILKSGILDDQKKVDSMRSLNNDLMLAHVVLKQEHDELIEKTKIISSEYNKIKTKFSSLVSEMKETKNWMMAGKKFILKSIGYSLDNLSRFIQKFYKKSQKFNEVIFNYHIEI